MQVLEVWILETVLFPLQQLYFVTSFRSRQILPYHDQSVNDICDGDRCLFCIQTKFTNTLHIRNVQHSGNIYKQCCSQIPFNVYTTHFKRKCAVLHWKWKHMSCAIFISFAAYSILLLFLLQQYNLPSLL